MKDHKECELPPHPLFYVKRPDLRMDELPDMAGNEELADWRWFIEDLELYETELQEEPDLERINALSLPLYQHIQGTPDPAKILAFFCLCHEWRVYPPAWIMNELYSRFNEYLNDNGDGKKKRRLGEYFGEPARGNRSAFFRNEAFKGVMQNACTAVDRLRFCFNLTKEESLGIVSQWLESVANKTSFRFEKGEAALEKEYRKWCKSVHCERWIKYFTDDSPTSEGNIEFLRSFPSGSFTGFPQLEKLIGE